MLERSDPASLPEVLKERLKSPRSVVCISWDGLKNIHFSVSKEDALTFVEKH